MKWKINRDKNGLAKELHVEVIGGVLVIDVDTIPDNMDMREYMKFLVNNKIVLRQRKRVYLKKKRNEKPMV